MRCNLVSLMRLLLKYIFFSFQNYSTFDPNALLNDGDFHLEPEQKPHVQDGYYPIQNGTNATINSMSNPMIQPVPSSKQYIGELQFQVMLDAKDNKTCVVSLSIESFNYHLS